MSMLEAALAYASQGFHIFPILPGQKRPLTQHGFKEATTDPEQIRAWWTAHPTANIGWHLDASGMCAIDLDIGAPMGLDLPATMTVKTPSGGRHMIYEGRIPSSQSKLAPHVDTRGKSTSTNLWAAWDEALKLLGASATPVNRGMVAGDRGAASDTLPMRSIPI